MPSAFACKAARRAGPKIRTYLVAAALVLLAAAAPARAMEPAYARLAEMGRGVNILGYDGIWDGGTDAPFKEKYFAMIRAAGFGHVRINLHAFQYMDAAMQIEPRVLERLDWVIEMATANGLVPVLDEHDFNVCQEDPAGCAAKLKAFWAAISARYQGRHPRLVYDLLNEPGGAMSAEAWNAILAELLVLVRRYGPERTIIAAALNTEDPAIITRLALPERDRNIIVTVHYYKPFRFTHQGAPWSEETRATGPVDWGSPEEEEVLAGDFAAIDRWARANRRPIYLGEFGVYDAAGERPRARYLRFVARTAERLGWSWCYWQLTHDFNLLDTARDRWLMSKLTPLMDQGLDAAKPPLR